MGLPVECRLPCEGRATGAQMASLPGLVICLCGVLELGAIVARRGLLRSGDQLPDAISLKLYCEANSITLHPSVIPGDQFGVVVV